MTPADAIWIALGIAAASAAFNLYSAVRGLGAMVKLPESVPPRESWPRVSLIVAACNEAESIEEATLAKLTSDYPNLEVVLVDDRSSDGTSEIADRLAARDARLRVVHVKELPAGWLGKVHALEMGRRHATGEWLLFSDADVHFDADLLRKVMSEVLRRELEFVTIAPKLLSSSFALDAIMACFMRMLVVGGRLYKISDPKSRVAVGGGVFNLAKLSAFDRSPGFEWLRMEIADDVALGQMMKRSGARSAIFDGAHGVWLHFYRSVGEMMRGLEKNGYAVFGGLRPLRLVLTVVLILWLEVGPLLFLLWPSLPLRVGALFVLAGTTATQVLVARAGKRRIVSALFPWLGAIALVVFSLRSAILTHWRGGVVWRGTLYPLAELRAGRRLELF
ncbi:MAG: glycosyltransferase [Sorangiineae bacterium PRO1]|nr:glycosyltransferase [Sorangiineae bacterium PRO1]